MDLYVTNVGSRFGVCLNGNVVRVFNTLAAALNHAKEVRQ